MAKEKCYRVTRNSRKVALILRCPEFRLIGANKRFIRTELKLGTGRAYYSLKKPGGAMALARAEDFPEDFRSVMSDISMFVQLSPDLTHIVLMSHEDCRRYDAIVDRTKPQAHVERTDLLRAAKVLSDIFPHLQIGAYYCRFKGKKMGSAYFETVFETNKETALRQP